MIARGLCFGEGPRWHDGTLWFSDMHDHRVMRLSGDGTLRAIVDVPNQPSGLGWRDDGTLLIVSMTDCRLLQWSQGQLSSVADLSQLASFHLNDMVVDANGRAYIGNFGFDLIHQADFQPAELICVEVDGSARVVANELAFPNGSVITEDNGTLIVAETFAGCLTAFDVQANGNLSNRRVWARLPEGAVPDGICLDDGKGIWVASPTTNECLRLEEGDKVTHRVTCSQGAYACMLGGLDGKDLYILTAPSSDPEICRSEHGGQIECVKAPCAASGLP